MRGQSGQNIFYKKINHDKAKEWAKAIDEGWSAYGSACEAGTAEAWNTYNIWILAAEMDQHGKTFLQKLAPDIPTDAGTVPEA